ncbi:zinc-dependent metalloprotease [Alteromonas oceanisediminis]|uniref:zinc-dependent metalloprotease n=1 Tax=Alteromonas oceanisediminis TaxID=2836180 RepID=UPI001BDA46D2|nr:zinc-dependent metalloprotease [Alteromonas oceanisediminis]MBT0587344.1 zinc-dependent metalloprotease [Alteromonas oceanisediminis]
MTQRLISALTLINLIILSTASWAKTIEEFTLGMTAQDGFIPIYYDGTEDKVYLKISAIDSPLIFQSSLPQGVGSNDIGLDRGQLGATRLVEFARFGNKVLLKQLNTHYRAGSGNLAEQASIDEAFADAVIAGLPVVAESTGAVLVDYTEFLVSDIHGISNRLTTTKQGEFKPDPKRSGVYLPRTKSFVKNTELEALVTFAGKKPGEYVRQVSPEPEIISVHLHHSFIELPDDQYQPRQFHPFSGFWKHSYMDYSVPIDEPMEQKLIPRHRLQKQNPQAESSPAVEPIVYYLDPGIPEPVMSALKDGALWWNEAFQAIGYEQAFQVKVLPEDADPMDVRYNVIQWVHRATRGWSYGTSVIDPRTGEIIKGHVTLGSLRVRQDYLIALGLTSPFVNGNTDTSAQKEMALARIRQLSAHEVGHTLGIAHNFAASEYGRGSVMDYPHPKATIVDGKIQLDDAYAVGMGAWDFHTVAYGYQDFATSTDEKAALDRLIAQAHENGYRYKSDPDSRSPMHPGADGHLWDNGADPVEEFKRIAQVRQFALARFGVDTLPEGTPLSALEETLAPLYFAHRYQLDAVAKHIGGVEYSYEVKTEKEPQGQTVVNAASQQRALDALLESLSPTFLALPEHITQLIIPKVYGSSRSRESFNGRTGLMFDPVSAAEAASAYSVRLMLAPQRLNRLTWQHSLNDDVPSVSSVVNQLIESTWKRSRRDSNVIAQRVKLVVLDGLMDTVMDEALSPENRLVIEGNLLNFTQWLKRNDDTVADKALLNHLNRYWQTGEWLGGFDAKAMPPGSPI